MVFLHQVVKVHKDVRHVLFPGNFYKVAARVLRGSLVSKQWMKPLWGMKGGPNLRKLKITFFRTYDKHKKCFCMPCFLCDTKQDTVKRNIRREPEITFSVFNFSQILICSVFTNCIVLYVLLKQFFLCVCVCVFSCRLLFSHF